MQSRGGKIRLHVHTFQGYLIPEYFVLSVWILVAACLFCSLVYWCIRGLKIVLWLEGQTC